MAKKKKSLIEREGTSDRGTTAAAVVVVGSWLFGFPFPITNLSGLVYDRQLAGRVSPSCHIHKVLRFWNPSSLVSVTLLFSTVLRTIFFANPES